MGHFYIFGRMKEIWGDEQSSGFGSQNLYKKLV